MPSFRISVEPHRKSAARFVESVRRRLQKAYADNPDITQSQIADVLGVHRSVINRQLRGYQDMTLGRVAELSRCMGYEPAFDLISIEERIGNHVPSAPQFTQVLMGATNATVSTRTRVPETKYKAPPASSAFCRTTWACRASPGCCPSWQSTRASLCR